MSANLTECYAPLLPCHTPADHVKHCFVNQDYVGRFESSSEWQVYKDALHLSLEREIELERKKFGLIESGLYTIKTTAHAACLDHDRCVAREAVIKLIIDNQ